MFVEPIAKACSLESLPSASIAAYARIKEGESYNTTANIPMQHQKEDYVQTRFLRNQCQRQRRSQSSERLHCLL